MDKQPSQSNTELVLLLGRLDGKLDTVLARQTDHDSRIRDLEKGRWFNMGVSGAVATIVSTGIALAGVLPR